jgi:hypothetical protein
MPPLPETIIDGFICRDTSGQFIRRAERPLAPMRMVIQVKRALRCDYVA